MFRALKTVRPSMRSRTLARVFAAAFAALLLLAGITWSGTRSDPSRLDRPGPAPESVLALRSGVLRTASADRSELLRDWARRDKRAPSGQLSLATVLAACVACLLAARHLIATGATGQPLRGFARSYAARAPPLLWPD